MKKYIRSTKNQAGKPIMSASQKRGYVAAKYFIKKYAKAMQVLAN